MEADSLAWAAMLLTLVGAPFRVLDPPQLTGVIGELGALFTPAADGGHPPDLSGMLDAAEGQEAGQRERTRLS
ncbi:hypothetical protein [Frankia canadensis]|uniref:hypothetical protein n=1 Tax=Frankia canadensis TaxID=1836972 RepID=UPI0014041098|nr:hypothetical protein [Frankia canadensis]